MKVGVRVNAFLFLTPVLNTVIKINTLSCVCSFQKFTPFTVHFTFIVIDCVFLWFYFTCDMNSKSKILIFGTFTKSQLISL